MGGVSIISLHRCSSFYTQSLIRFIPFLGATTLTFSLFLFLCFVHSFHSITIIPSSPLPSLLPQADTQAALTALSATHSSTQQQSDASSQHAQARARVSMPEGEKSHPKNSEYMRQYIPIFDTHTRRHVSGDAFFTLFGRINTWNTMFSCPAPNFSTP